MKRVRGRKYYLTESKMFYLDLKKINPNNGGGLNPLRPFPYFLRIWNGTRRPSELHWNVSKRDIH